MDVISSVLAATPVEGVLWSDGRYRAPWALAVDDSHDVAGFHLVLAGRAVLHRPGAPGARGSDRRRQPVELLQGDVVVVPNGAAHVVGDHVDTAAVPIAAAHRVVAKNGETRMACGAFRFGRGAPTSLLSLLPPLLHLTSAEVQRDELLRSTLHLLTAELDVKGAGSGVVVDRLVDVLFIAVVRRWLAAQPVGGGGWLGALRDPHIGRVLAALHHDVAKDVSVDSLARLSGLSRSAFARRFLALVGTPPLTFVAGLRVDAARRRLRNSDDSIAEVATAVGYDSEFAFSRAFKRATGLAPSHFRQQRQAPTSTSTPTSTS